MKVSRVDVSDDELGDPHGKVWQSVASQNFPLVPTPLNGNPAIKKISPFIEKSTDHGTINQVSVASAHNGIALAVHLTWAGEKHDKMVDLDEFVDGAAVMFPLTPNASAFLMGSPTDPVNAWYWKGNLTDQGFDVIAQGYGTSARSRSAHEPIRAAAQHVAGNWHLVMCRALKADDGRANFKPGAATRMAFAVWDGGNRERAGRKSFSGDFIKVDIDP
jgi:DMSO reductase family type II enzyme heme b subunit